MAYGIFRDAAIASAAVRLGFATSTRVHKCFGIQRQTGRPLSTVLLESGTLSPTQLVKIERSLDEHLPVIEGYDIVSRIGSGGMGDVYLALETRIGRRVALKILKPELAKEPEYVERFMREARAAARFSHKNIVMAYDIGVCDGVYFLSMEYVEGKTLGDMIRARKRLPEREAIPIAIGIAEALQGIFQNGLIHRDLKPENVIVTPEGVPKLCDLGIARKTREADDLSLTHTGTVVGTPHYLAPEQIRGAHDLDIRVDIYAFGALLFAMLSGRPPFVGETAAVVFSKHLNQPVPNLPDVSAGAFRIVAKCLAKNRLSRYTTPAALLADLQAVAPIRATTPLPTPSRPLRTMPVVRKSKSPWWAAGVIAAVGLIVTAFLASKPAPSAPRPRPIVIEAPKVEAPVVERKEIALPPPPPPVVVAPPKPEPAVEPPPPPPAPPIVESKPVERPVDKVEGKPDDRLRFDRQAVVLWSTAKIDQRYARWAEAAAGYDRLMKEFADSPTVRKYAKEIRSRRLECKVKAGD